MLTLETNAAMFADCSFTDMMAEWRFSKISKELVMITRLENGLPVTLFRVDIVDNTVPDGEKRRSVERLHCTSFNRAAYFYNRVDSEYVVGNFHRILQENNPHRPDVWTEYRPCK